MAAIVGPPDIYGNNFLKSVLCFIILEVFYEKCFVVCFEKCVSGGVHI
jgi:hypothetical protein